MAEAEGASFLKHEILTVHTITWNVKGKSPGESLEPVLETTPTPPDLYVIGLQEIVDFNIGTVVMYETSAPQLWEQHIEHQVAQVHGKDTYVLVAQEHLVGVELVVLALAKHAEHLESVTTAKASCGLFGLLANKGAAMVRLQLLGLQLVFVCAHLNSGQKEANRRNNDFHDITRKLQAAVEGYDCLVWLGDLNYRVDNISSTDLHQMVLDSENWADMVDENDQLVCAQRAKKAFVGFNEARLNFAPTYRYVVGTSDYDAARLPAWTDRCWPFGVERKLLTVVGRVLWSSRAEECSPACLTYRDHSEMLTSDHKPVSALLAFDTVQPDEAAAHQARDEAENGQMPSLVLDPADPIELGEVSLLEPSSALLVLSNHGDCEARWRFAPKMGVEEDFGRSWLLISPLNGLIQPGDSQVVTLQAFIDGKAYKYHNSAEEQCLRLHEILVLHLEEGRDFFVEVSAVVKDTCAGVPLSELPIGGTWHHGPWKPLFNELVRRSASVSQISMGDRSQEAAAVVQALTSEDSLEQFSVSAMVQATLQLLEALPQPLICTEALSASATGDGLEKLAAASGSPSSIVIGLMAQFLKSLQLTQVSEVNQGLALDSFDEVSFASVVASAMTHSPVELLQVTDNSLPSRNGLLASVLLNELNLAKAPSVSLAQAQPERSVGHLSGAVGKWFWQEEVSRLGEHDHVMPPHWVPFDDSLSKMIESCMREGGDAPVAISSSLQVDTGSMVVTNSITRLQSAMLRVEQ